MTAELLTNNVYKATKCYLQEIRIQFEFNIQWVQAVSIDIYFVQTANLLLQNFYVGVMIV